MRVLMSTDTIGGVWTFTEELASGLLVDGHAVALVSLGAMPNPAQWRWVSAARTRWADTFVYESLTTPLEWMQSNQDALRNAAPQLLQLADRFGAELLHSSQFCFGTLSAQLPTLITAHSDVLSWWRACRGHTPQQTPWLDTYKTLVGEGLALADAVAAPTQCMLHALGEFFALPAKTTIIPNGRSLAPAPQTRRMLQAVTAGRLWDEGKQIKLLDAVRAAMPLLVAGDDAFEDETRRNCSSVRSLGRLDPEALTGLFAASSLYICTSIYEPFGLAPLEAALSGCALLLNDLASLREVWADAAEYFTDAASLSALLQSMHDNPHRLAALAVRSTARARLYTRERMTAAYVQLYRTVLDGREELASVA